MIATRNANVSGDIGMWSRALADYLNGWSLILWILGTHGVEDLKGLWCQSESSTSGPDKRSTP